MTWHNLEAGGEVFQHYERKEGVKLERLFPGVLVLIYQSVNFVNLIKFLNPAMVAWIVGTSMYHSVYTRFLSDRWNKSSLEREILCGFLNKKEPCVDSEVSQKVCVIKSLANKND